MRGWNFVTAVASLGFSMTALAADKPFDPTRDSAKDLAAAEQQAKAEHKNILMDVGGNWCPWCILVDRTLAQDAELHALLEKNYIVLHVNTSKENRNDAFLKNFPEPKGYPAWYVLAADGKLLRAQDTGELEQDHNLAGGYNRDALKKFLTRNAPQ